MPMIETAIYWTGASVLLVSGVGITVTVLMALAYALKSFIIKDLRSTYNHVQLRFVMQHILKNGYQNTVSKAREEDWKIIDKES